MPHIHEIEGVKDIQYLKELSTEVAHNLDVSRPLKEYLLEKNDLHQQLMGVIDHDVVTEVENAMLNIRNVSLFFSIFVKVLVFSSSS